MQIILITGQSGVGKTAISKELVQKFDKYNFIYSYTDRFMRSNEEWGHIFVDSAYMDMLLERSDVVAKSEIQQYRYCAIESQFDKDKINVYITDVNGINDIVKNFPQADIMIILIRRDSVNIDAHRSERDILVPAREDVDFLIDNDSSLTSAVGTINALVNMDLFRKPSHTVLTIEESLDELWNQYRMLDTIKQSLEEQLWYRDRFIYNRLIDYVSEKINKEFDVEITPDIEPIWNNDESVFRVMAWFKEQEQAPMDIYRLNELLSKYSYEFCKKNDCLNMLLRLYVDSDWIGVRDERG